MDAHKYADEIQIAIDGLRKTEDRFEHYDLPATTEVDLKWGEGEFRFEPIEGKSGFSQLHIDYANVKTPEDAEQHAVDYRNAMAMASKAYMKDKRAVYKYIADNIDKWWD
jgi:hypothetical protein